MPRRNALSVCATPGCPTLELSGVRDTHLHAGRVRAEGDHDQAVSRPSDVGQG